MPVKANIWSGYRFRVGLIAAICLGFASWCLYDAKVKYPLHNRINAAYESMLSEYARANPNVSEEDAKVEVDDKKWPPLATEEGWPTDPLKLPHRHSGTDIFTQYLMLTLTAPFGLVFGFLFLRCRGRWVACDEQGLTTSWGQTAPFDQITRLNKRRWKKGIAIVYHQANGQELKLTLDDWKFDRELMDQIVAEVESRLSPDQIDEPNLGSSGSSEVEAEAEADAEGDAEGEDTYRKS